MKEREAAGVVLGGGELRPMDVCVDPLQNRWNKVVREVHWRIGSRGRPKGGGGVVSACRNRL
jgi:hypothetical protein